MRTPASRALRSAVAVRTATAAATAAINGRTVGRRFPASQAITRLWSGTPSTAGPMITVHNAGYNAAPATTRRSRARGSTRFGVTATGDGTPAPAALTSTSP